MSGRADDIHLCFKEHVEIKISVILHVGCRSYIPVFATFFGENWNVVNVKAF